MCHGTGTGTGTGTDTDADADAERTLGGNVRGIGTRDLLHVYVLHFNENKFLGRKERLVQN